MIRLIIRPSTTRCSGFFYLQKSFEMEESEYQKALRDFDKKIAFCLSIHCERTAARWKRDKEAFINEYKQSKTENR